MTSIHYEHFFNASTDLQCVLDENGIIMKINHAGCHVLGFSEKELQTKSLLSLVFEEDLNAIQELLRNIKLEASFTGIEARLISKSRTIVPLTWTGLKEDSYIYLFARDKTRLIEVSKKAEDQASLIAFITNNVPILISYIDKNECYRYVNNNYYTWYKKDPDSIIGKSIKEVLGADNYSNVDLYVKRALAGEMVNYELSKVSVNSNKSRDFYVTYIPDVANDSTVRGFFALINDITEIKSKEYELEVYTKILEKQSQEFKNAKIMADHSNKVKSEFLANVSHELRTPLNTIIILSDLLFENKYKNLNEKQLEYSQLIQESGKELLFLINDLLDLAKIESGKYEVVEDWFNINDFIEGICTNYKIKAKTKGLAFRFTNKVDVHTLVYSDKQKIKQITNNFLSNGIKFTKKGGVALDIKLVDDDGMAYLVLAVTDTGKGIAEDKVEHIFEPFRQEDNSISRQYGGTGLGLAICSQFTDVLKGKLRVESVLNSGTVFTLKIPVEVKIQD